MFPTQLFTQWIRWVFVDHLLCARLGAAMRKEGSLHSGRRWMHELGVMRQGRQKWRGNLNGLRCRKWWRDEGMKKGTEVRNSREGGGSHKGSQVIRVQICADLGMVGSDWSWRPSCFIGALTLTVRSVESRSPNVHSHQDGPSRVEDGLEGDIGWGYAAQDHCSHKNEGWPGRGWCPWGRRGRAMEKQIQGELSRTCDC